MSEYTEGTGWSREQVKELHCIRITAMLLHGNHEDASLEDVLINHGLVVARLLKMELLCMRAGERIRSRQIVAMMLVQEEKELKEIELLKSYERKIG